MESILATSHQMFGSVPITPNLEFIELTWVLIEIPLVIKSGLSLLLFSLPVQPYSPDLISV